MKKSDLFKLIERKRILKESLEMVEEAYRSVSMDEVGGFDDPEIMSQYHGNYFDELAKIFFHFDELSDGMVSSMSKIMDSDEQRRSKLIIKKYVDFMEEYHNYLVDLKDKVTNLSKKSTRSNLPGMDQIGLNENR
jgi:hypothetical protein